MCFFLLLLFDVIVVHVFWDSDPTDMCIPHLIDPAVKREVFWDFEGIGVLGRHDTGLQVNLNLIRILCVLRAIVFALVDSLHACVYFKGVEGFDCSVAKGSQQRGTESEV